MIIVLSPAKTLDFESPPPSIKPTLPQFVEEAQTLTNKLKRMSVQSLSELMSLSKPLAELNSQRYKSWQPEFTDENSQPAVFAFKGDVYVGLDAETLSRKDLVFAQAHLRVLSGLYGVLRPLDLMQPYRLEMGTRLAIRKAGNLYDFWDGKITDAVNEVLAAAGTEVLVNLASNEYFKAIQKKRLNGRVVSPEFKDWKNGQYKVISFFAKKARGAMARYLIQNRVEEVTGFQGFDTDGYVYNAKISTEDKPVFTRKA